MAKTIKKTKRNSIDLRKRSGIVIETAEIDTMSQAELTARIKRLNEEITQARRGSTDLDFMIVGPKMKAMKQMRMVLKERLALK